MIDFLMISTRSTKRGVIEIYPKFIIKKSSDLMIRGGDFYAIWNDDLGLWSTDENDALQMIDRELDTFAKENRNKFNSEIKVLHMWDAETGMIDSWHRYCQKQMRDSFHMLDEKLIFSNDKTDKKDYASKRLKYPLEKSDISAYERLMSVLYSPEERHKIEWAIGSIVSGDSKKIQKFMVLYGSAGTGKSTVLNIIQQLFDGYFSVFDAKALGSSSNSFALEAFKSNPLVAIQHDGDLSRIEDNTRLNSLVSHEMMTVNEKFKSTYTSRFKCFLFMGTNKPVKITDAKSGLIRRLIDVSPSGQKLDPKEYKSIMKRIEFELGGIAYHCREVYLSNRDAYEDYIPIAMLGASNDFYNFIIDSYHIFKQNDGTTLLSAWKMYNTYCDDAKVAYPCSRRVFKEELKNYFREYRERFSLPDGTRVRSYYDGFRTEKFEDEKTDIKSEQKHNNLIVFDNTKSIFDDMCSDCLAQYASSKETPLQKWDNVNTKLSDLDTTKLHYVKVPENHIVIDFDIPDNNGKKDFEKNLKEASKWPPTYAELSKSGCGIHLHYIYKGDVSKLSRVYDEHIEVKVFSGKSSLRRKLVKCNNLPVATICSGLPLKGDNKMVNFEAVKSEKGLRALIKRNLNKEIHPGTKPSIDFINKILQDAYDSGLHYDVSDMKNQIFAFAANSTNQSGYCIKLVNQMKFKSEEPSKSMSDDEDSELVFYDVEVFPNLFLINWKIKGDGHKVIRMINPSPAEVENLVRFRLIGFNCRRYDNHMLYARMIGYTNEQLFNLSQKIINGDKNCFFGEAYNISYTDVYDFASAGNKKSLKKFEIELGIHHHELGLPWDQPVPEDQWSKVAEYCDDDVLATEAVFNHLSADWTARQILADLAEMSVNDTTNSLTTRIIFGKNRHPQNEFNYRNLAEPVLDLDVETYEFLSEAAPEMMKSPHGKAESALPYFPGYKYDHGVSTYKNNIVGEGGRVYAEPGMYVDVALLDIASMHPHSTIMECLFGVRFTKRFKEIVDGRVSIKHKAWDDVNNMLDGKLTRHIQKVLDGVMSVKELANALKTAINSVYGLTSATFENPFNDIRNIDNIVAKRGALFMIDLQCAVQERGFTVAHIKTDSIKIPNATPDIIKFVMDFGKRYGYTFEHEATYERMCLVNNAVYIAKFASKEYCMDTYGYAPDENAEHGLEWTATGAQFAVPYVFKTLFSKEPLIFEDMCEIKSVSKGALYLDNNEGLPDVTIYEDELKKRNKGAKRLNLDLEKYTNDDLQKLIDDGHSYSFIGKVGQFCPIKESSGGGVLYRGNEGKYYAATGTDGYRWMESETVKTMGKENDIDRSYYDKLVDDAVDSISQYGDFEWFVSDNTDTPIVDVPWYSSCGKESCVGCPHYIPNSLKCASGFDISDLAVINADDGDAFAKR